MSNIVGEEFREYVANQINLRQEIHGKKNRNNKDLIYLNSRTSWVKLASGVKVDEFRLKLINQENNSNYTGIGLAQNFVLFNGTSKLNSTEFDDDNNPVKFQYSPPKAGILGNSSNPAYGMLGDTKFGLVPMPGIESVSIKTIEKGSIRIGTVKIKAYSREQFNILDILYLRLGYTLLLEWGDSHYLDNKNTSDPLTNFNNSLTENQWFNTSLNTNQFEMLKTIELEREKYSASYDAIFGRIRNFKWNFNKDGTYDITLDVISLGDVVESLKMNIPAYLQENQKQKGLESENEKVYQPKPLENILEQIIDSLRKATDPYYYGYNTSFWESFTASDEETYKYQQLFSRVGSTKQNGEVDYGNEFGEVITINNTENEKQGIYELEGGRFGDFMGVTLPYSIIEKTLIPNYYNLKSIDYEDQDSILHHKATERARDRTLLGRELENLKYPPIVDYIQMNFYPSEYQYYIRLGAFLKLMQDVILPHYNAEGNNPVIKFNCKTNENLMYFVPNMISIDPKVCIISNPDFEKTNALGAREKNTPIYPQLEPFIYKKDKNSYGYLMNVYVNFYHVSKLFKQVNKDGDIMLGEMMRTLCNDISKALGSVNNLEPKLDPSNNTYTIYDKANLPNKKDLLALFGESLKTNYEIELFGYNLNKEPNQSNFVHQAGITTEVTNEYAIMTTIGATADNQVVGEESTAFSKWNQGIEDRFKQKIHTGRDPSINSSGSLDRYIKITSNYYKLLAQEQPDNPLAHLGLNRQYINQGTWTSTFLNNVYGLRILDTFATTEQTDEDGEAVEGGLIDPTDPQRPIQIDFNLISSNYSIIPAFYTEIIKKAYEKQLDKKTNASNQGGFMPFNLNLELDGISGIKIYSRLRVQQDFLPSNYPESLEFIVTDVEHTLQNNQWVTKLNTIGIPLQILTTTSIIPEMFDTITEQVIANVNPPPSLQKSTSTNGPNADNLRQTLQQLGYTEKGNELDNGGDISRNISIAASDVFKKIKEIDPSISITVTGGNDYFHQNLASNSRHKKGNGIDFVISPASEANLDKIVDILNKFTRANDPNFRYIDEYRHLTKNGTADHLHISWGRGTEASDTLNKVRNDPRYFRVDPNYIINI